MSKKRTLQGIAILLLLLAAGLLIPGTKWQENSSMFGFISLALGTVSSIISMFIPTSYTFKFSHSDWQTNVVSSDFSVFVEAKKHGIGRSPQVQTFIKKDKIYEEMGVLSHHDEKGNITISANSTFIGKSVIT